MKTNQVRVIFRRALKGLNLLYSIVKGEPFALSIFITERCNSRCKICGIWKKKNPQDMSVELFRRIINDVPKRTSIIITGGEPLLHPRIDDVFTILTKQNRAFSLLSNGILADLLIEKVKKFNIKSLTLSCDGPKETYKKVRGVDNYDNIIRILEELSGKLEINLRYTINPLNNIEDLIKVKELADSYGVKLGVSIYDEPKYFDTTLKKRRISDIDPSTFESFPFDKWLKLYNSWLSGNLKLPCYSIRFTCTILPDGKVLMCQAKDVVLGDLNEKSFKQIWHAKETKDVQRKFKNCNECWLQCQRPYDIALCSLMSSLLPKTLLNKVVGKYDWDKL